MMLAAALLLGLAPQDAAPAMPRPALSDDLAAAVPRLVALMREGIDTRSPNSSWARRHEAGSVFDGSYDWHSCVIAHFALLTHARLEQDTELAAHVLERLDGATLRGEAALLAGRDPRRSITFPYDEAWLLMLLAELERHEAADVVSAREVRLEVEARVLDHLERADFPDGFRDVRFCGFYRSWLFSYLLLDLSGPVGDGAAGRLRALRAQKLDPVREAVAAHTSSHDWDFLWLPAILALADRADPEVPDGEYAAGGAGALPEGVTIATVHQLGVFLTRLWPCAYDGARGDAEAWAAFEAGTRALLAREDLWAQDFAACSHWVPQYMWLGYWCANGMR